MNLDAVLVSVVIPAHNARLTIDETLRSVRSQTHEWLDIIVVDDGSTDDTVTIAQRHAAQDSRISIIRQENAGVASARNSGWRGARSDFVAFIDADDLWAPTKIERQLRAMLLGGERTGLIYSWYVLVDAKSRMIGRGVPAFCAGDVLDEIFAGNFIGNGSAVLVRRQALLAANGFDSRLREAGAEGCEDHLFYCRVAEGYHFAVVPEYLIGYRYLPENMSSNLPRMLQSWMLVVDEMVGRHPNRTERLNLGLRKYGSWLLWRALARGQFGHFGSSLSLLICRDPLLIIKVFAVDLPHHMLITLRGQIRKLRSIARGEQQSSVYFPIDQPD